MGMEDVFKSKSMKALIKGSLAVVGLFFVLVFGFVAWVAYLGADMCNNKVDVPGLVRTFGIVAILVFGVIVIVSVCLILWAWRKVPQWEIVKEEVGKLGVEIKKDVGMMGTCVSTAVSAVKEIKDALEKVKEVVDEIKKDAKTAVKELGNVTLEINKTSDRLKEIDVQLEKLNERIGD